MSALNESVVEDAALSWFGELGYAIGHGPHMAPGEPVADGALLQAKRLGHNRVEKAVLQSASKSA